MLYGDSGDGGLARGRPKQGAWQASCPSQGSCFFCPKREIIHLFVALVAPCWDVCLKTGLLFLSQDGSGSPAG